MVIGAIRAKLSWLCCWPLLLLFGIPFFVVRFVRTYVFVLRCNPCFCGVMLSVYASLRLRLPMCADHSMNFTFCLPLCCVLISVQYYSICSKMILLAGFLYSDRIFGM